MKRTNDKVDTPFGDGVVQGNFEVRQGGETVEQCVLVRVPITDANRHALGTSKCMTPNATQAALFVFADDELE